MGKWKNCEKKLPRSRKHQPQFSETVLTYNGTHHSIAFYDYKRREWEDVTVNSYINDMSGMWCYLKKPPKKLKMKFE